MQALRQEFAICPATSVCHVVTPVGAVVFVGGGSILKVFRRDDHRLLAKYRVFPFQAIHGLSCKRLDSSLSQVLCLIWGGYSARLICIDLKGDSISYTSSSSQELKCQQWLLHGVLGKFDSENKLSVRNARALMITAANEILLLEANLETELETNSSLTATTLCSGPSTMLYSADLLSHTEEVIIIAAGTVLGEVFLWTFNHAAVRMEGAPTNYQMLDTFVGHEGSVFGISIASTPSGRLLVATCSDDRSVLVWNAGSLDAIRSPVSRGRVLERPRAAVAEASGHYSRIWSVRFQMYSESSGFLISFGEDCMAQQWSLLLQWPDDSSEVVGTLQAAGSLIAHSGKNIWASHVDFDAVGSAIVGTGGADGQIVLHTRLHNSPGRDFNLSSRGAGISQNQPSPLTIPLSDPSSADVLKSCIWLDRDSVLAVTERGQIISGKVKSKLSTVWTASTQHSQNLSSWVEVFQDDQLRSYSIMRRVSDVSAVVSDLRGSLYLFQSVSCKLVLLGSLSKKVVSIYVVQVPLEGKLHDAVVVTCAGADLASLFILRYDTYPLQIKLDLSRYAVVTSAVFSVPSRQLILGVSYRPSALRTRTSSLLVFNTRELSSDDVLSCTILPSLHGSDAITSILELVEPITQERLLLTTGRDHRVCVQGIAESLTGRGIILTKYHEAAAPGVMCPEGAMLEPTSQTLLVWGFRGTSMLIFNLTENREVARVDCGGSHRSWDVMACAGGPDGVRMSWTRMSTACLYSSDRAAYDIIQSGTHGREIRCVAIQAIGKDKSQLIATGSEDTDIHISTLCSSTKNSAISPNSLTTLSRIRKHNTGFSHLTWSSDGRYLFSAGGQEEFFVWRIRRLPCISVGVVLEAQAPSVVKEADLRIMDFTICEVSRSVDMSNDVETRDEGGNIFLISMVYSNSSIRTWSLDLEAVPEQRFKLLSEGTYGLVCLTAVHRVLLQAKQTERLLVAGTDGHISFWPVPELSTITNASEGSILDSVSQHCCLFKHQIHRSAIKCMAVQRMLDSTLLVITGGDDNALGLTLVRSGNSSDQQVAMASTLRIPKAHAAAVTAVKILRRDAVDEAQNVTVVTASNDQTVKLWKVHIKRCSGASTNVSRLEVNKLCQWNSDIADIGDIDAFDHNRLIVVGVGSEVLEIDYEEARDTANAGRQDNG